MPKERVKPLLSSFSIGALSDKVASLPVRLMVGHLPLEEGIGVRVPDRQQVQHGRALCASCVDTRSRSTGARSPIEIFYELRDIKNPIGVLFL